LSSFYPPLPPAHQRRLRTSNPLERVNRELKRRTRVAGLFPNEASLLRLVSALLADTSEAWETGKTYLKMDNQNPALSSKPEIRNRKGRSAVICWGQMA